MPTAIAKPRVLVIEDNKADVYLLQQALEVAGVHPELTVLDDGGEALRYLCQSLSESRDEPHLVVLDLNLPSLGGLDLLAAARERQCLDKSPIVALTSSQSVRDRARATALGVAGYLVKPADLDDFLALGPVLAGLLQSWTGATSAGT